MERTAGMGVAALFLLITGIGHAAEREVRLRVDNMYCAACPYIVQQLLEQVPGVHRVEVRFRQRMAVVDFDDAVTSVKQLTEATAAYGYPSRPEG